jgi:hypothetical protein
MPEVRAVSIIKRGASWALKLALTGGSLWYIASKIDIQSAWTLGKSVRPSMLVAAYLLQIVQIFLCGGRWLMVLKAIGAWLPFWKTCRLFMIANFFGQVLPGAVGADAVRVLAVRRAGLTLGQSINSVMLERLATVFGLVLLVSFSEPLLADRLSDTSSLWVFPVLTVAGVVGILVLALLDSLPSALNRWRVVRGFVQLAGDTRRLFLRPRRAVPLLVVVVLGHINLSMVVWVLALGIGAPVSMLDCMVLVPPVILVATMPISISGWGARELAMVTAFGFIGVPAAEATVVSILFGIFGVLIALPGGAFWLFSKERRQTPEILA